MAEPSPSRRTSRRKRTAPTLFVPGGDRLASGAGDSEPEEDDVMDESDVADEGAAWDGGAAGAAASRRKAATGRRKGAASAGAGGRAAARRRRKPEEEGEVFGALRDKNAALTQVVRDLLAEPKSAVLGEKLVLFFLECCGISDRAARLTLHPSTFLQNVLDFNPCDELVGEAAVAQDCFAEHYPHGSTANDDRWFVQQCSKFWAALVSDGGVGLVGTGKVLEFIVSTIEQVSKARLVAMRHTSVATASPLGVGLVKLSHELEEKVRTSVRQLESRARKAKADKAALDLVNALEKAVEAALQDGSSNHHRAINDACGAICRALPKQAKYSRAKSPRRASSGKRSSLATSESVVDDLCEAIESQYAAALKVHGWVNRLAKVVISRSKDANPAVRGASTMAIAQLTAADPSWLYLSHSDIKVKLDERVRDPDASVRIAAAEAVSTIIRSPLLPRRAEKSKDMRHKSLIKELTDDLRRVGSQLIENIRLLNSPELVAASISAMAAIQQLEFVKAPKDWEEPVRQCLTSPDLVDTCLDGPRKAAAKYILLSNPELGCAESDGAKPSVAASRIRLAHFVELLSNFTKDGEKDGAADELFPPPEVVDMIVRAFWPLKQTSYLQNWEAILAVLRSYGEKDRTAKIGDMKALAVASTLRAAAACASEPVPDHLARSARKAAEKERHASLEALHDALTDSLGDCVSTFRSDVEVLRQLVPLASYVSPERCTQDLARFSLERLIKALVAIFASQAAPDVLDAVARTFTTQFCGEQDHPLHSDAKAMWNKQTREAFGALRRAAKVFTLAFKDGELVATSSDSGESSGDEAQVGFLNALRRSVALLRRQAKPSKLMDAALRVELKPAVEACIQQFASEYAAPDRFVAILADATLLLEIDLEQHVLVATELALMTDQSNKGTSEASDAEDDEEDAMNDDGEDADGAGSGKNASRAAALARAVDAARERLEVLSNLLDHVVARGQEILGAAKDPEFAEVKFTSMVAAVVPVYFDLITLCPARLKETVLHELAWRPARDTAAAINQIALVLTGPSEEHDLEEAKAMLCGTEVSIRTVVLEPAASAALVSMNSSAQAMLQMAFALLKSAEAVAGTETSLALGVKLRDTLKAINPKLWAEAVLNELVREFESGDLSGDGVETLAQAIAKQVSARKRMCPDALAPAVQELVNASAKYALAKPDNLGFLDCALPFAQTLRKAQLSEVRTVWMTQLGSLSSELASAIFQGRRTASSGPFVRFEKVLGVSTQPAAAALDAEDPIEDSEGSGAKDSEAGAANAEEDEDGESAVGNSDAQPIATTPTKGKAQPGSGLRSRSARPAKRARQEGVAATPEDAVESDIDDDASDSEDEGPKTSRGKRKRQSAQAASASSAKKKNQRNAKNMDSVADSESDSAPEDSDNSSGAKRGQQGKRSGTPRSARRSRGGARKKSIGDDESTREIEKNLAESDTESIRQASQRHRKRKSTTADRGGSSDDDAPPAKRLSSRRQAAKDTDDESIGFGRAPRRRSVRQ